MKVLMVGATGKYAGLVLPELKKRGAIVRAFVRNEESAQAAMDRGADETALGDLEDAASLSAAAAGTEAVFHINPAFAPREAEMGLAMLKAAEDAGISKFVFSGVIHPSLSQLPNHAAKLLVEEAIYESGMIFTVLQPTMFMQTIEQGWDEVVSQSRFALPYSKQVRVCYVDYRDVAEAAALALTSDKLDYGTFELCAEGMVNRIELALLMSDVLGRSVEAEESSFDDWAEKARIPEGPVRDGLKRMFGDYDEFGFPGGNSLVLEAILGRPPRTLRRTAVAIGAPSRPPQRD